MFCIKECWCHVPISCFFVVVVFFSSTFCDVLVFGVFYAVASPKCSLWSFSVVVCVFCFLMRCFLCGVFMLMFYCSRSDVLQKRAQDMCPRNLFQKSRHGPKKYLQEMCPRSSSRACTRSSAQRLTFVYSDVATVDVLDGSCADKRRQSGCKASINSCCGCMDGFRVGAWVLQLLRVIVGARKLQEFTTCKKFFPEAIRQLTPGFARFTLYGTDRSNVQKMISRFGKIGEATDLKMSKKYRLLQVNSLILLSQLGLAKDRLQAGKILEKPLPAPATRKCTIAASELPVLNFWRSKLTVAQGRVTSKCRKQRPSHK